MTSTLYPNSPIRTIPAHTFAAITARAGWLADEYHIHNVAPCRDGRYEIELHDNDNDKVHFLYVTDTETTCDCRGYAVREMCSHSVGLPRMMVSFSALTNLRIETNEKRESFLIDKDIEQGISLEKQIELKAKQGELTVLAKIGTNNDSILRAFRVQNMAQNAKGAA